MNETNAVFATGKSVAVDNCQICGNQELESVLFLGYLPSVNIMRMIGAKPHEEITYPAQLLFCPKCNLVQLGFVVDAKIIFPAEYPYTSSTTKILRDNFSDLYQECRSFINLDTADLVVDIGSNDGNLLSNFKNNHKVLGITPEDIGQLAIEKGIPTLLDYFNDNVVSRALRDFGQAKLITATNVFAHIENIHSVLENILRLLKEDGVFISESHYLLSFINKLQYDTIYHEHLRYYSLHSLKYLFEMHGMEIFNAKQIPTHGGSIRVYAARRGRYPINSSVLELLQKEAPVVTNRDAFREFKRKTVESKLNLHAKFLEIKKAGGRIYGISSPSRASTLINYIGIDDGIIDCILEVAGSHKIGKYAPGKLIPVLEESVLYIDQPEYVLLFSWHIADELIPKIKQKGYKGKFIIPLPELRIVE